MVAFYKEVVDFSSPLWNENQAEIKYLSPQLSEMKRKHFIKKVERFNFEIFKE